MRLKSGIIFELNQRFPKTGNENSELKEEILIGEGNCLPY